MDARSAARWVGLGTLVGLLAGLSSAGFLVTLEWATHTREDHPALLFGLPAAGLAIGAAAHHLAGPGARTGAALIVDELHTPTGWLPRRLGPLVYVGTVVTHLFGGSAGREGTAVQLSGSLTDLAARGLGLDPDDRGVMLTAALAGGFGAVFGVPLAGAVFGLEVQHPLRRALGGGRPPGGPGRIPERAVASIVAAAVGDAVVGLVGVTHTPVPRITADLLDLDVIGHVAVTGAAAGLVALAFVALTHRLKAAFAALPGWPPLRPALGGLAVVAFALALGTDDYLGLSVPLATAALAGAGVATLAFALKLAFTAVTVGSGFPGGEVTPLFVIGATLGATVAAGTGGPAPLLAAVGFVAVFAGAAEVPVACTVMAAELFGVSALPLFALGCGLSWACSSSRSIYPAAPVRTG